MAINMEMQILLQKEYDTAVYFNALHNQDEKQKILIHDIKKHLRSIAELNEQGEREKTSSYINQITQSSDLQASVRVCDNDLLNTILLRTKWLCEESDTSLITDIRSGCLEVLSEYDITALFSNLLDNAVDATKHIPGSFIELSVTPHNDNDLIITMMNSCKNNPFSAKGHRLVSSKQNKRNYGYGMKSIQRVVTKYHGNSQFHFESKNSTFHTVIILKL